MPKSDFNKVATGEHPWRSVISIKLLSHFGMGALL